MPATAVRERFRALGHRNFRLYWTGQLVSLVGTWMQSVAQGWLMHRLTGSALMLDRKSTRLNSCHPSISYAVFCLKKKKIQITSWIISLQKIDKNINK